MAAPRLTHFQFSSISVNGSLQMDTHLNQDPDNMSADPTKSKHPDPVSLSGSSSDGDSPYGNENLDFSNTVLTYINDVLMEEDGEGRPCMLQDCLALQAAEKSFYDVLAQKYPPSPDHTHQNVDAAADSLVQSSWTNDQITPFSPCLRSEGMAEREAKKELWKQGTNGSIGKVQPREFDDCSEDRRKNKHPAIASEDLSEENMFDEVFLVKSGNVSCPLYEAAQNRSASRKLQDEGQLKGDNNKRKTRKKKPGNKKEMVDIWSLLNQCAQAVATYDHRAAVELLGRIRQHSSPYGDGSERLAHYFSNGLEVRLNGTGEVQHTRLPNTLAADTLKAYTLYVSACPFRRISNLFANRNIAKLSKKATKLHVIDFGISYGFQWPCLIQRLSQRRVGPPRLKITGIDFPQPGFRPAERVEATGHRLRRCCENVNVPFEYNAIAKRWESIQVQDLKIETDEIVVVNCMYRLRNLPDDSLVFYSPRNIVLKLIKRIKPDLFIHGVVNGSYNVPFFLTRFREAFYHYSTMFDILENNVPREDPDRLILEREMFGREVVNVIAYEGMDRIDRPETYKQWQFRNQKIGFRPLALDQNILSRARNVVKSDYHKDFTIEVDGQWILQGWKGRMIHAISCWKPVQAL